MDKVYEAFVQTEYARDNGCCECGFVRNGAHHPRIKCPKTGRCGTCGNDWPCNDHAKDVKVRRA